MYLAHCCHLSRRGVYESGARSISNISWQRLSLSLSHSRCLSLEMGEGVCVLGSKNGSGTLRIVNWVLSWLLLNSTCSWSTSVSISSIIPTPVCHTHVHTQTYIDMYLHMYVCKYVGICLSMYVFEARVVRSHWLSLFLSVCMHVCAQT